MAKKEESTTNPTAESLTAAEEHKEIARLAYSYWQARGCPVGSPEDDWYRAENELRQPMTVTASA